VAEIKTITKSTFYAFLKVVIQYIKTLDSSIKNILYFSDAAASQ
jgi:hypothetical protein